MQMKNALTIAGSDSSGGAGIQADLKTFSAHGVFGLSVITAVTAQNTRGVFGIADIPPEIIKKQLAAVFEDILVAAVKIGMLSQSETIKIVAAGLREYRAANIVLDPVMVSKSGCHLLAPQAVEALIKELLPLADIVTPNIPEAEVMTGLSITTLYEMEKAARAIFQMGAKNVLLKGGHLANEATDLLFDGQSVQLFPAVRIATKNTHGTGCTLSSAIAANLAKGFAVAECVARAKEYITTAIEHSLELGGGAGPVHHFYALYQKAGLIP